MKKFLLVLLAIVGILCIIAAVAVLVVGGLSSGSGRIGSKTVLEVDLEQGLEEVVSDDPIAEALGGPRVGVVEFLHALERAAKDDRVVGLVARVGTAPMGLARHQEIRDAVEAFRKSGKFAVAWSETMGEFGSGTGAYYLATAFDEIYLQPSGDIGFTGLMYETPFMKGAFDKLGVVPKMDHRWEYKNAMNTYTETKFTPPHREALDKVMQSQFDQIVRGVSKARGLDEAQVRAIADRAPILGKEALDAKLVDGMLYRDEVYAKVRERAGGDPTFLWVQKYWERAGSPYKHGPSIAVIHGVGAVQRGNGGFSPLTGSAMGSDTVAGAFRDAVKDKDVRAIVFRVDSPGGSYVASDTILREVVNARKAGKPVIVTMGDVAGSGGYFVAMEADKIVAQPGTITGSIGVLAGKLLTDGFWEKTGLSWDDVHTSASSTMWTGTYDYTPEQWAKFQGWLDRIYADFTGKVAEGRKLPLEKVQQIAKGRIWSGEDAKEIGLVDEIGGFPVALTLAKQAAKIDADAPVTLRTFPRKKTLFEKLTDKGSDSSEPDAATVMMGELIRIARPVAVLAEQAGLLEPAGALSMPPVRAGR
ncbi:MAG TPA: signal peptide peptidase SppA [Candidatus Polarisedimenticolaceae bacterium]